jgi:CheY-like chemotaxis protein
VLLAVDDVAARLTLEAVLSKSGYSIDSAASSAEAMDLIEGEQYALVLCNLGKESAAASRNVVRLASRQDYRPATAYLTTARDQGTHHSDGALHADAEELLIEPVDIPSLLTDVAELLANRAADRAERVMRRLQSA